MNIDRSHSPNQQTRRKASEYKFDPIEFGIITPNWIKSFAYMLGGFVVFMILSLSIVPWQQTSQGTGNVIAFDPNDRVQKIQAGVSGRIKKWYVRDGSQVKEGDPIVEVVDNDPNFVNRLIIERDAALQKYEAAKIAAETALINMKRQEDLLGQGLTSRQKFEKSKITYKKLLSEESSAAASLAKAEVKLSRQETQLVKAPQDGQILRVLHGSGSVMVTEGDSLAIFVPSDVTPSVEAYISGNDLPLVEPGRNVRLQFEGWPAVQFSGWPSIAIGTFGGIVNSIDPSANKNGKFRVIIVPDKDGWPNNLYLRQGTRAHAWILLNEVTVGYEIWRQLNGFPPSLNEDPDFDFYNDGKKDKKKKKKKDK